MYAFLILIALVSSTSIMSMEPAHNDHETPQNMVWIDLETSGLNPDHRVILEIACIITDSCLKELDRTHLVIHQPDEKLNNMKDKVFGMHANSGLLDKVKKSKVTCSDAEEHVLKLIQKHCPEKGKNPLCGNSIHFDRSFLVKYMPRITAYLDYRVVDVSSLSFVIKQWNPTNQNRSFKKQYAHRALGDIEESIAQLKYYRDTFIKTDRSAIVPRSLPVPIQSSKLLCDAHQYT